jgi:hypothetical protein
VNDDTVIRLQARLEASGDDDEKDRIRDAIAEHDQMTLTGDAHTREGADATS